MQQLIIGAGATLAEAKLNGSSDEFLPPTMKDFARKAWGVLDLYSPHPVLEIYLNSLGYTDLGEDPRKLFFQLESDSITNIEKFLEFAWKYKDEELIPSEKIVPGYIYGLQTFMGNSTPSDIRTNKHLFWENLLYHGIGHPLSFLLSRCFWQNGLGWKNLPLSRRVASSLRPGDWVLNLNYDTIFEMALEQEHIPFTYSPNISQNSITVCKPHGSLNLVSTKSEFYFGNPNWHGTPQPPDGFRSYTGLIPPRLNKDYSQNWLAQAILTPIKNRFAEKIIFWGIGFTESDIDLTNLYRGWLSSAKEVLVINPDKSVADKLDQIFSCNPKYYNSIDEWELNNSNI